MKQHIRQTVLQRTSSKTHMENVDEETEAKLAQVGNIAKNGRICLFLLEGRIQHCENGRKCLLLLEGRIQHCENGRKCL